MLFSFIAEVKNTYVYFCFLASSNLYKADDLNFAAAMIFETCVRDRVRVELSDFLSESTNLWTDVPRAASSPVLSLFTLRAHDALLFQNPKIVLVISSTSVGHCGKHGLCTTTASGDIVVLSVTKDFGAA